MTCDRRYPKWWPINDFIAMIVFFRKREYFMKNQISLARTNCTEFGHFGSIDLLCIFHVVFLMPFLSSASLRIKGDLLPLLHAEFSVRKRTDFKLVMITHNYFFGGKTHW